MAVPALVVAAVLVAVCVFAIIHDGGDEDVDTDGMYRGYDAHYSYRTSGSDADTYASHLESAVSDARTLFVQSALEGYPLRTLGAEAFSGCSSETLFIPATVEGADPDAFDGCAARTIVFLGEIPADLDDGRVTTLDINGGSVETVAVDGDQHDLVFLIWDGEATLIEAAGSGDISIPESVRSSDGTDVPVTAVGSDSFRQSSFGGVELPDTLLRIFDRAFYGCDSLESVSLSESLVSIEDEAFRHCANLGDVDLQAVGFIGFEAFRDCHGLRSVVIPDSVGFLGDGAFYICTSVEEVRIGAGVDGIPDRAFGYGSGLTHVVFEGTVGYVGAYSFAMCSVLESVDLSDVRSIGDSAFTECRMLSDVTLDSVVSIGDFAFSNCRSLASVDLPPTLESIGDGAFLDCRSLSDAWFHGPLPEMGVGSIPTWCTVHASRGYADSWAGYEGNHVLFRWGSHELEGRVSRRHHGKVSAVSPADDEDVAIPHAGASADHRREPGLVVVHVPVGQHDDAAALHHPCRAAVSSGPDPDVPLLYAVEDPLGCVPHNDGVLVLPEDVGGYPDIHGSDPEGV